MLADQIIYEREYSGETYAAWMQWEAALDLGVDRVRKSMLFHENDRSSLLSHLRDFHGFAKHLKRVDKDSYEFLSRIGIRVVSDAALIAQRLADLGIQLAELPSNGAFAFTRQKADADYLPARIIYFRKMEQRKHVQHMSENGEMYQVSAMVCGDDDGAAGKGAYLGGHVFVHEDGRVQALKECMFKNVDVQAARSRRNGRRGFKARGKIKIPQVVWNYPWMFHDIAQRQKCSVHEAAESLLAIAMSVPVHAAGGVTVRSRRNSVTSVFTIDAHAAKKLFRTRERIVARDGKAKRIFHWNRGSWRQPAHWKGLRDFEWHGYDVHIRADAEPEHSFETWFNGPASVETEQNTPGYLMAVEAGSLVKSRSEGIATKDMNKRWRET